MYVLNKKCFYKSSLSSADHRNAINKTNARHSSWKEDPKFPAAPEKEKKTRQVFNLKLSRCSLIYAVDYTLYHLGNSVKSGNGMVAYVAGSIVIPSTFLVVEPSPDTSCKAARDSC